MHVSFGPYLGFKVKDFDPIQPPRPSCCSNATVLCANCARLALERAGVHNELTTNTRRPDPGLSCPWETDAADLEPVANRDSSGHLLLARPEDYRPRENRSSETEARHSDVPPMPLPQHYVV